jgi:hypothetical protein
LIKINNTRLDVLILFASFLHDLLKKKSYGEKIKAHNADKLDDPLSECALEAICKEVRKDLEAGFQFPEEHPISQAARNGQLDGADVVRVGGVCLFHVSDPSFI